MHSNISIENIFLEIKLAVFAYSRTNRVIPSLADYAELGKIRFGKVHFGKHELKFKLDSSSTEMNFKVTE